MKKNKSGIYQYLIQSGLFNTGSHDEIENAKKEYWRKYKADWRKQKRRQVNEITVSFTDQELRLITVEAKKNSFSPTRFIKEAAIAYMSEKHVVPDIEELRTIQQLLSMSYNSIMQVIEENRVPEETAKALFSKLANIEIAVSQILHHQPEHDKISQ